MDLKEQSLLLLQAKYYTFQGREHILTNWQWQSHVADKNTVLGHSHLALH